MQSTPESEVVTLSSVWGNLNCEGVLLRDVTVSMGRYLNWGEFPWKLHYHFFFNFQKHRI